MLGPFTQVTAIVSSLTQYSAKFHFQATKSKKKKKGVNLTVSRGDGLDDYEAASYDGYDDFI